MIEKNKGRSFNPNTASRTYSLNCFFLLGLIPHLNLISRKSSYYKHIKELAFSLGIRLHYLIISGNAFIDTWRNVLYLFPKEFSIQFIWQLKLTTQWELFFLYFFPCLWNLSEQDTCQHFHIWIQMKVFTLQKDILLKCIKCIK